tara:strand:- start:280 stop:594 length:315 start_codon:yes stop_codon:yes gene_type:complete
MLEGELKKLSESDAYKDLCAARSRAIWPLAIIMLVAYYSFILVIAFDPELFATKIGSGYTSLGIVCGFALILFTFLITGLYVHKANKDLEPKIEAIQKEFGHHG